MERLLIFTINAPGKAFQSAESVIKIVFFDKRKSMDGIENADIWMYCFEYFCLL